ncbi:MAG: hypothetical protein JWP12_2099 [Bacteroidetes bacterium]|nr:hypothetical protein [Bacteroidota bacterium]
MRAVITLLLVFSFAGLSAQTQSDTTKGKQYYLKAKIIDTVDLPPYCGTFAFATVVEMEIISFPDALYTAKNIGVIFTCPEFYKNNFFETGKVYELKVADKNPASFDWMILNEKKLEKYKLTNNWWVVDAKKLD